MFFLCFLFRCFFFFKQKTAYEMRISDWSSDVCSSDLTARREQDMENRPAFGFAQRSVVHVPLDRSQDVVTDRRSGAQLARDPAMGDETSQHASRQQIVRSSCRERVSQYVLISVVAFSLTTKQRTTTGNIYTTQ